MADRRATSSELYAMSKHLAVKCYRDELAYLNCKDKYNHPEDCLQEAKAVIKCSESLLLELYDKAPREFKDCIECLDYYTLDLKKCHQELKALEKAAPLDSKQ
eukprot:GHRR01003753.1.p2 GENE.GHRR01003753.1~~GHRR01003753.1.p2  ORF type:complete len:103 (+),score=17.58 GHRR01003753.1:226-534(+)